MKKIKIYFWKHGFQTDGVSLWVVQIGKKKWFTKSVRITGPEVITHFSSRNPHAFLEINVYSGMIAKRVGVFPYFYGKELQRMPTKSQFDNIAIC